MYRLVSCACSAPEQGHTLDPLAAIISTHVAAFMRLAGRQQEAESILRNVLELDADFVRAHEELGLLLLELGRLEEGVAELETATPSVRLAGRRRQLFESTKRLPKRTSPSAAFKTFSTGIGTQPRCPSNGR